MNPFSYSVTHSFYTLMVCSSQNVKDHSFRLIHSESLCFPSLCNINRKRNKSKPLSQRQHLAQWGRKNTIQVQPEALLERRVPHPLCLWPRFLPHSSSSGWRTTTVVQSAQMFDDHKPAERLHSKMRFLSPRLFLSLLCHCFVWGDTLTMHSKTMKIWMTSLYLAWKGQFNHIS